MKKSVISIVVSVILGYFSFMQYSSTSDFVANGNKTTATVIVLLENYDDEEDSSLFTPVYEYVNEVGDTIEFQDFVSSSSPDHSVGDKVDIIYMPNTDDVRFNTIFSLYGLAIALSLLAMLLMYIGIKGFMKPK